MKIKYLVPFYGIVLWANDYLPENKTNSKVKNPHYELLVLNAFYILFIFISVRL